MIGNPAYDPRANRRAPERDANAQHTYPFSASFNAFAGVNATLRAAGISMGSPVLGFRPWRAGIAFTLNCP